MQESGVSVMERARSYWRGFTQDENQKIIIKYYQKK